MDRSSGILLPVSALPGPCGIGDLGADAGILSTFSLPPGSAIGRSCPSTRRTVRTRRTCRPRRLPADPDLLFGPSPFLAPRARSRPAEVRAIDWGADPMRVDYDRVYAGRTALWDAAFAREKGIRRAHAARRARG